VLAGGGSGMGQRKSIFADGSISYAEVHWYEAHGIGTKELKIKRIIEIQ
jgi:hypothetical protein